MDNNLDGYEESMVATRGAEARHTTQCFDRRVTDVARLAFVPATSRPRFPIPCLSTLSKPPEKILLAGEKKMAWV